MQHLIHSIGVVSSPYTQKFGIPRQPQLVPAAKICITLNPEFSMDSVRGLDGFEYIWVQFLFHDAVAEGWAEMVRPPRLGGKKKMGVFATRSPHRPNHMGLSLLPLERVDNLNGRVQIWCKGGDLLDGTPVLDIKPYIPFVEAKPDAQAGFVSGAPEKLAIEWQPESGVGQLSTEMRELIEQSIAQDPRPAYQEIPERVYGMEIAGFDVKFRVVGNTAVILSC
ncbi:tRNA (N6-threonylcarbamoyladenosine(37)-N6)-methyltransferase TrmO [Kingella negevensis]|uniref:Putative tRNA (Adenine(37)-N6)-methyltransferase n=1 Tax=Kingella negevensis TaxID=1522312 RepID=A0A238TA49_9NEIS|nr:tRNA (N6-threonylcarbamoyladenosine(37)-N6)-methyltransferase TrmO [Kingella negevensis]MDK4679395.1 tRNA (N6-threonylcarbamoyladenosine(37)-N6)-methyltransferase TrmO [Kingella negevensis]MDK4682887.1 tRNA (N6-threonylcarbamoyladenosine(37)-N6)-methyltransferase TrmO [Kingella negevensis]MDK4685210.1 tRNA (N6-threonylcarbamoyladenosine(37)-N6)-methyltransferase TrmO [Kingella negevensis]MDK4689581.1 tRNA (N6-threonylcarbamoyladenosine(37)-N6)-methyltransferase TrmO [Kingella negevensis]MDK